MAAARQDGDALLPMLDMDRERQLVGDAVKEAVFSVLHSGKFIMGPQVPQLEAVLARFIGPDTQCVAVSSGTDALLLSLLALGIGPGDEVITTPFSWISSAEVIPQAGATPVFADVLESNCLLDPAAVRLAITPRTKAVIAVSLFGQVPDLAAIRAVLPPAVFIIEDAAQSFGARCSRTSQPSCGMAPVSDIAATSFFPSKPLGCYGDGGAVFTNRADLADIVRGLRVHGKMPGQALHTAVGYNARLDTLQAAILLAKWPYFPAMANARRHAAARYREMLHSHPNVRALTPAGPEDAYGVFTVVFQDSAARNSAKARLHADGIACAIYYATPINKQPAFRQCKGQTPVSQSLATRVLSIPIHAFLTEDEQRRIVDRLLETKD